MGKTIPITLPPVFEATVLMDPVPKLRARTVIQHGKASTYTPDKTAAAEDAIKLAVVREQEKHPPLYFDVGIPVAMELDFHLARPKSVKRRYPTVRPDWDNLAKTVCDALQYFVYVDDAQVVDVKVSKRYVAPGERPRICIRVRQLEG